MKKLIISVLFLVLLNGLCFSQKFETINQNEEYTFEKNPKDFFYISPELDETKGIKVADMKFYAREKGDRISLVPVFYALWKQANKLGANSFFVSEIDYSAEEERFDILTELYFLDEEEIDENIELYPENMIVIIGNVNTNNMDKKGKKFKLDDEEYELYPFEYKVHEIKEGEKTTLKVGGAIGGSRATIKGEEGSLPLFYSVGGTSIAPSAGIGMGGSGVGISFRSGTISPIDMNLGLFLLEILKVLEKEEE